MGKKSLKEQSKDLLNQLAILLKDIDSKTKLTYHKNDAGDYELTPDSQDLQYLISLKAYAGRAIENDYNVEHNEEQYYNSNCY